MKKQKKIDKNRNGYWRKDTMEINKPKILYFLNYIRVASIEIENEVRKIKL